MIDLVSKLITLLNSSSNWLETNPPLSSLVFTQDEYNPSKPSYQILIEDMPNTNEWVTAGLYHNYHRAKITIYLRPISYGPSKIDAYKTTFIKMKTQIDKIIKDNEYSITGIKHLTISGWNDGNTVSRGKGIKNKKEPLQFVSTQIVQAEYYI